MKMMNRKHFLNNLLNEEQSSISITETVSNEEGQASANLTFRDKNGKVISPNVSAFHS